MDEVNNAQEQTHIPNQENESASVTNGAGASSTNEVASSETKEVASMATSGVTEEDKPVGKPKKRFARRFFGIILLAGFAYVLYLIAHVLFSPDRNIQQIYLIPEDAAFIIETSDPVNDWRKFSQSDTWKCLKQAASITEISKTTESLDSVVQSNKTLLSLVGKRDILISLHKTRATEWGFLAVVDLQKVSKIEMLRAQFGSILKMGGGEVTQRTYNGVTIHEMRIPETQDILYVAFLDNHLVLSFTSKLLQASIDSRDKPMIGLQDGFIAAEKLVSGKGLVRLYINYAHLPQFMSIYLNERNDYIDMFSNSMDFAGMYFHTDNEKIEVKGYSMRKEESDPYVAALLGSGKHKMKAHEIMSARTALYTNIGFDDPATFVKELENTLSVNDKAVYDEYVSSRKKIETLFGISLNEHFLSWMSGEFAMSQSDPGLLSREPELILAIRAKSSKDAREKMDFIEKRIKNRTPVKIKTTSYKEYDIKYLEMVGFFRLFFGKIFDKFEKPYYTYIDDYVVFSNRSSSLLSFIEDYEQDNLLKNDPGFTKTYNYFHSNSTAFVFADIHKFFPQLEKMATPEIRKDMQANQDVLNSFPYWTMQIVGDKEQVSLHYVMDFKLYEDVPVELFSGDEIDKEDKVMKEDAESEKELMSELKRFYVEKFEGNVLREFYPEGALKSESEVKEGKRHGRYREYYEDGIMKVRGKYSKNQPKGTWKYYTPEGKFEKKEKF